MGRIVMGYWNCTYCATRCIKGSERDCPNCGHPRDKNVKFYTSKDIAKVVDNETAKKVRERGRDWKCPACDCLNPGNVEVCISCGIPKGSSEEIELQPDINIDGSPKQNEEISHLEEIDEIIDNNIKAARNSEKEPEDTNIHKGFNFSKINFPNINWKKVGIVAISLLLCAVAAFLLIPYDKQVEITGNSWSRSISIEEYRTVEESDWSVPPGGRITTTRQEIHHYDSVLDHYEEKSRQVIDHYEEKITGYRDLGNGYFEEITTREPVYKTEYYKEPVYRQDPVYATKYYYEIERWLYVRSVNTNGNDKSPYWGKVYLNNREREGTRSSHYYVSTTDGAKYSVSESDWNSLNKGDNITLSVNRLGYAKLKSFQTVEE